MAENIRSSHGYASEATGSTDREDWSSDSRASSSNHMPEISSLIYFEGTGGGELETILTLKQLNKRLRNLEEETKFFKQTFLEGIVERKNLMDEIYVQLQIIRHAVSLRNQRKIDNFSDGSFSINNPLKEGRTGNGLSQILPQESNRGLLLVRDLRAKKNAILLQDQD